jgi:hypothetical protein
MIRNKALLFVLVLASFSLAACSGPASTGCTVNCNSTGSVAVTLVADSLPANPSLLSFQVTIASIKLTTSAGTSTTVNLIPALTLDLMRLQSDTAFLGTMPNIPTGQYTSATLAISGNATITFLNNTNATISTCPVATICSASVVAAGVPVINLSFTVSQNAVTGIGLDVNLNNTVSISAGNLVVDFTAANALSAFTLPRANSNLASGQLDLIEDFTGVVSLANSSVTITSATRRALTASATSGTIFDTDPSGTLCQAGTIQLGNCVANNQVASMDVVLNSDGTLSVREIEPLLAAVQDTVEGIVVSINPNQTQFTLVVTDFIPLAQNSLILGLHVGDGLTVNIPNPNPFLVDTKGLPLATQFAGNLANFVGATTTSVMRLGQVVSVHVTAFTAANGTTIASSTSDSVTLRWSRFTAAPGTPFTSNTFNVTGFPPYFFAFGTAQVQAFAGTPGTPGTTNFDGIADASGLNANNPVAVRALFIENTSNTANPGFFAAKVRQH